MRVLFIAKGDLPDFQSDMIFHGGRSIIGENFIDCNKIWYMYEEDKNLHWNNRVPENGKSYGRGFTLYGRFKDDKIDRSNIRGRIEAGEFDKIIYGSATRCLDHIDIVLKRYKKDDLIFVDGEDNQDINQYILNLGGIYFKRELNTLSPFNNIIKPINFAIPEELIVSEVPKKVKDYAHIIPGDFSTYIYDNQQDYFKGYQDAYFGITHKKGGWDCLRHYEILMNGCIPYFSDLEYCPKTTMITFPKDTIIECMKQLKEGILTEEKAIEYSKYFLNYTKNNLTTKHLINSLL
jgi:hypothetical protein